LRYIRDFTKTAQSKQPPNRRNFAQSGPPVCKVCFIQEKMRVYVFCIKKRQKVGGKEVSIIEKVWPEFLLFFGSNFRFATGDLAAYQYAWTPRLLQNLTLFWSE
jgi:uncharacterized protein YkuJ